MNPHATLRLVQASAAYRAPFLEMAEAFRVAGETRFAAALEDVDAFLAKLDANRREAEGGERDAAEARVPQTTFWLLDAEGTLLASTHLRHRLSPGLLLEGGHIGYVVRPDCRGRGLGTRLLALVLEKARHLGIERALITCDSDNLASARVIEKNGGQPWSAVVSPESGKAVSRYWIDLGACP